VLINLSMQGDCR